MKRLISLLFLMLAAFVAAVGCATPGDAMNAAAMAPNRGIAARGGDSSTDATSVETLIPIAQPGATAVASSVRDEDKVQSSNAAGVFALNLAGDGSLAREALKSDPVVASYGDELKLWGGRLAAAETPEARAEAVAGLNAARAGLAAHVRATLEAAAGVGPKLDQLQVLVYSPIYMQSAGEDNAKLDADAIRAGAEAIAKAVEVAVNATK